MTLSDTTLTTELLIGGEERPAAETFPVFDPARAGTIIGHAASASARRSRGAARCLCSWPQRISPPGAGR